MSKAIRIYEFGGPEVLQWEAVDVPEPGEGEARIRHTAIGLNFIDVYHRSGLYPVPSLPARARPARRRRARPAPPGRL